MGVSHMDDGSAVLMGLNDVASRSVVTVGDTVTIRDTGEVEAFRIVCADESDPGRRWISEDCPLARALLGHSPGDVVRVHAPYGNRNVSLLRVGGGDEM